MLPLDDRQLERINPASAGRPTLIKGNTQLLFGGMGRLSENSVLNIKNKSYAVTAELEVPDDGADGVIIAQGGRFGGWSLYAKDGKPSTATTCSASSPSRSRRPHRSRLARHQVRMEFAYDGGGLGKGGDCHALRRRQGGRQRPRRPTQGVVFSADETTDVGCETGTTVSPDYTAHTSKFSGTVNWVQIDLGEDAKDADHYIEPDERFRIAMARQ